MRPLLAGIAGAQVILALLFAMEVPWVTDLWPFQPTSSMSHVFIASIFLAAAASVAWCLVERSDRGLSGIALDYVTLMVPLCLVAFAVALDDTSVTAGAFGGVCLIAAVFGVFVLRWSLRRPWRNTLPTPRLVLLSFALFVLALVVAGSLLVLGVRGVLPWPTTPLVSRIIGLMFLGAAAYFGYGLVDRRWENAGGQLAGFLAYDVVLIVPFVVNIVSGQRSYYDTTGEPLRLNLLIYTGVVLSSGVLAFYYLFLRRDTRLWPRKETAMPAQAEAVQAGTQSNVPG